MGVETEGTASRLVNSLSLSLFTSELRTEMDEIEGKISTHFRKVGTKGDILPATSFHPSPSPFPCHLLLSPPCYLLPPPSPLRLPVSWVWKHTRPSNLNPMLNSVTSSESPRRSPFSGILPRELECFMKYPPTSVAGGEVSPQPEAIHHPGDPKRRSEVLIFSSEVPQ